MPFPTGQAADMAARRVAEALSRERARQEVLAIKDPPADVVAGVARDLRKALPDPTMRQHIVDNGLLVGCMPCEPWLAFAKPSCEQWGEVARHNGIEVR